MKTNVVNVLMKTIENLKIINVNLKKNILIVRKKKLVNVIIIVRNVVNKEPMLIINVLCVMLRRTLNI